MQKIDKAIELIKKRIEDYKICKRISLTSQEKFLLDGRIADAQYILAELIEIQKE